jgi:hypothetical protein
MIQRYCYPPTWQQLAQEAKERAGWMCEMCMVPHGAIVRSPRTGNPYVIYLQAAHVNHDHDNPYPELKAVCPICHARYYRKPKTQEERLLPCKRLRILRRTWTRREAQKKLARSLQASGASNDEMFRSKNLPSSPSYSSRVQFGWQLEERRYE